MFNAESPICLTVLCQDAVIHIENDIVSAVANGMSAHLETRGDGFVCEPAQLAF